ncbi:hypothetical protein I5192_21470 (plasmid) [Ruegeria sp. SCSIO 43209]|uniref:hypothetical protein n=1 Tax=Ruegeria sp. SCSIO 43209 TaxID=2793010 RepID=UPI001CA91841|nr:hypothetical protein [Ruegeria sp. SCSIO 43209]UAB91395.1 hypothetical protein I5192_21470 [Ruegeria sp. SCSIO 43209]
MPRRTTLLLTVTLLTLTSGLAVAQDDSPQHFDPKGKLPSDYTIEFQQTQRNNLMGWMAPASTGVAMRHSAGVKICL